MDLYSASRTPRPTLPLRPSIQAKGSADPDSHSQAQGDSPRRIASRPLLVAFSLAVAVLLLVVFTLILPWQVH
jgi:hypothetical protein